MAKIPITFQFSNYPGMDLKFLKDLEDMYSRLAIAINLKSDVYIQPTDGQTTDTLLSDGSLHINSNTLKVEMLTSHPTATSVTWTQLS